jgi:hypothetical protein
MYGQAFSDWPSARIDRLGPDRQIKQQQTRFAVEGDTMALKHWTALTGAALLVLCLGCGDAVAPVASLEIEPTEVTLGFPDFTKLTVRWEVLAPLGEAEGEPMVFVHLLDEPGSVIRTFNHPLRFDWQPGRKTEYEITLFQSSLAPPLAPGSYLLSVGLYDTSGRRWPLAVDGVEVDRNEYQLGEISVVDKTEGTPRFYFSPAWMAIEGGMDRQILARRWLIGEGTIRVSGIARPGSTLMVLNIPGPTSGSEELILEEGAEQPTLKVLSNCGETEISASGLGIHEIELPVAEDEEGRLPDDCEIVIRPNFHFLAIDTLGRRSVSLEVLAWSSSG